MHLAEALKVFRRILLLLNFGFAHSGARSSMSNASRSRRSSHKSIDRLAEHAVGLALVHFERTDLVDQLVDHVAQVQRIQHAHAEIDGELQPWLAAGGLDAVASLKQQHAEAVEAGILQRKAILRLIHAEAARAAGAGGEEDVVVEDLLAGHAFLLQQLQIPHQIADGEISRIALAVVAELLAGLESAATSGTGIFSQR